MPFRRVISLLLLAHLATPAAAAQLQIQNGELMDAAELLSGKCSLTLKGRIGDGDASALEALLEDASLPGFSPTGLAFGTGARGHTLCLDSPGGDDRAALALAGVILGNGLVTVVPDGAACFGACAVSFMAGTVHSRNSDGGARMPMRVLHIGGELGFHAPALADPGAPDGGEMLLDYIAAFAATFAGRDSFEPTSRFPAPLFIEMMSQRDATLPWRITTTGLAGSYDIRLAGIPPVETDEAAWMRACNNLSLQAKGWQQPADPDLSSWDWRVNPPPEDPSAGNSPPEGDGAGAALTPAEAAPDGPFFREVLSRHHHCLIYHTPGESPAFSAWYERLAEDSFPRLRPFDLWQTLPHYTPLAALHGMERAEPGDFRTLYAASPAAGPHPDLPALLRVAEGQSLVGEDSDTPAQRIAIWFGPGGEARLYPAGEETLALPYRLDGDQICLTGPDGTESCEAIVSGAASGGGDGTAGLRLMGKDYRILYLRPGDIGPLPPSPPQ